MNSQQKGLKYISPQSILGLLLKAHAQVAAQAHGEEFIHHNTSAMCCYETAQTSIESAIFSVHNAEIHQFGNSVKEEHIEEHHQL
jgi:hypothetical protein